MPGFWQQVCVSVDICVSMCILTPTKAHSSPACYKLFYSIIKNPTDPGGTPIEEPISFPFPHPKPSPYFFSIPSILFTAWVNSRETCKYPPAIDCECQGVVNIKPNSRFSRHHCHFHNQVPTETKWWAFRQDGQLGREKLQKTFCLVFLGK